MVQPLPTRYCPKSSRLSSFYWLGDTAFFGPEAEFFIFDDVRFDQTANEGYYYVDSVEGRWNSGKEERPNLGYKPRFKEGYFPVPPTDTFQDIRTEMLLTMARLWCTH